MYRITMERLLSILYSINARYPVFRNVFWLVVMLIFLFVPAIAVFKPSKVETFPTGWEKSFYLSPPYISAGAPRVVSRGNFVAAVYQGKETEKGVTSSGIYASISFNGGISYIRPIKLSSVSGTIDHNPHAALSPMGHIAVAWQNIQGESSNSRLFMSVSRDMGASWEAAGEVNLIRDGRTESDMDMLPQVYYDDRNHLHLFYHSLKGNVFNLFHTVSENGALFSYPRKLVDVTEGLRGAFFPTIKIDGSSIYLVWQGRKFAAKRFSDDLFFMKSNNYGSSWSSSRLITRTEGSSASPSLELAGDLVYVAYQDNSEKTWGIWLSTGKDGGNDWNDPPVKISDTNSNCYSPTVLRSDKEEVVVVWYDLRAKEPRLHARKYNSKERKLSDVSTLSREGVSAVFPVAAAIDKKIVVLWKENDRIRTNFSDIFVAPPKVFSRTHPADSWSRAPAALIEIVPPEDESGVKFFSIVVNQDPNDNPPDVETLSGKLSKYQTPLLDDGVHYVHVRAIDNAGNISKTIHYKLQISRTPLQVSELNSKTHPEGKPVASNSPVFQWDISPSELLRTKGFLIDLTKDKVVSPKKFTTDLSATFKDLEEGRYFFNIRAVDKTNFPGTLYSYQIIIGQAEALDLDYIKKIASRIGEGDQKETKFAKAKKISKPEPAISATFPFDTAKPYGNTTFDIYLAPLNIPERDIEGFSVALEKRKTLPEESINMMGNVVSLKNLKNGSYHFAYRARYSTTRGGKKTYHWTAPEIRSFTIEIPMEQSPVIAYSDGLMDRLSRRWGIIAMSMALLAVSIVTVGFGSRLAFYFNLARYNLRFFR